MTENGSQIDYQEYPVFKGLQRPLEFLGFEGRYIYWADGTVGGAMLLFFIFDAIFGFLVALIISTIVLGVGGVMIFIKQRKGLHSKQEDKGLFIAAHLIRL